MPEVFSLCVVTRDSIQSENPDLVNLSKSIIMHEEDDSNEHVMFYRKDGILMHKWRPPDAHCDEKWREVVTWANK